MEPVENYEVTVEEEDGQIKCVEQKRHLQDILTVVLCSERVNQMNKTYNDIDAVTRLLEEKENDLELAARIGQGLLEKNKELSYRAERLEDALNESTDKISQLRHELSMKDALLQTFSEDYDADCYTPASKGYSAPAAYGNTIVNLERKLKDLEDDNSTLKSEVDQLLTENESWEYRETNLVEDCVRQLDEANKTVKYLEDELEAKNERLRNLEAEINELSKFNVAYACKSDKLADENSELQKSFEESQVIQAELTNKLAELRDKYSECEAMLLSAREEAKHLRHQAQPSVVHQHYGPTPAGLYPPTESLAMELQRSWSSQEEGNSPGGEAVESKRTRSHLDRILDTARSVRHTSSRSARELCELSLTSADLQLPGDLDLRGGGEAENLSFSCPPHHIEPQLLLPGKSKPSFDTESLASETVSEPVHGTGEALDLILPERRTLGRPGIPGSTDLETALRRLNLQSGARHTSEGCLMQACEREARQAVSHDPTPCPTPGSDLASPSEVKVSGFSRVAPGFQLPDKLRIIKPLEGSLTLHHWKRLAQPRIETLLEPHPGVRTQTQPAGVYEDVVTQGEVFSLADVEEDDDTSYVRSLGNLAQQVLPKLSWLPFTEARDADFSDILSEDDAIQLEDYLHRPGHQRKNLSRSMSITDLVREKGLTGRSFNKGGAKGSGHRVKKALLRVVKSVLPTSMVDHGQLNQSSDEESERSRTLSLDDTPPCSHTVHDLGSCWNNKSLDSLVHTLDQDQSPFAAGLNSMTLLKKEESKPSAAVTRAGLHAPFHSTPHGYGKRYVKRLAGASHEYVKHKWSSHGKGETNSGAASESKSSHITGEYSSLKFPNPGEAIDSQRHHSLSADKTSSDGIQNVRRNLIGQFAGKSSCGAHGDGLQDEVTVRGVGSGTTHRGSSLTRQQSRCSQTEK